MIACARACATRARAGASARPPEVRRGDQGWLAPCQCPCPYRTEASSVHPRRRPWLFHVRGGVGGTGPSPRFLGRLGQDPAPLSTNCRDKGSRPAAASIPVTCSSPRLLGPHRIQSPPSFRSTARRRTCGKLAHIFAPAPRPASNRVTPVLQIHGPAANMWQVGPGSSAHKAPQPFRRAAVTRESPSAGGRLESSHLPPSGQRPAANTWQVGPAPTARPSPPRSAAASPCLALQQGAAA